MTVGSVRPRRATLEDGGEVTCVVTITDGGRSLSSGGTPSGGYNGTLAEVCRNSGSRKSCN